MTTPEAEVIAEHKYSTENGDVLECGIIEINEDRQPVAYAQLGGTTVSISRSRDGRVTIEIDDTADEPVYVSANTYPLLSAGHLGYANVQYIPWTGDEMEGANDEEEPDLPLILAMDDDYCPKSEDETHHFGEDWTCDHCGKNKEEA